MSGLSCADALTEVGHDIALFDKARAAGGRMSTRRVELPAQTLQFDHGAQYFTVRDHAFQAKVAGWDRDGVAARWPAAGSDAWVGTPGMNAPVKAMADRHKIAWTTRIDALVRHDDVWQLTGDPEEDVFDAVVVAVPAEQARPLLDPFQQEFADAAARSRSAPCWTAMIAFADPVVTERLIVRDSGAIRWAARDGSKPGRGDRQTWIVQASPEWSIEQLERSPEEIAPALLGALQSALQTPLPQPVHLSAHRWRYARSDGTSNAGALWDPVTRLGACGDWLIAPRAEAAWLSGLRLAVLMQEV